MKGQRCPFYKSCRYSEVCQDHRWFCVWGYWLVLAGGVAVISVLVWKAGGI